MATNTRKKLCSELTLGDQIVLPRETVKLTGEMSLPYCIVSDESKGKVLAFEIEYSSGPLKGQKGTIVVLSEAKADYVLKDPLGKRMISWIKANCTLCKPKAKKKEKKTLEVEINRGSDWMGF